MKHRALICAALIVSGCGGDDRNSEPARGIALSQAPSHVKMLAELQRIAARTPDEHHYHGDRRARELREDLIGAGATANWKSYVDTGVAELRLGREREGIELLQTAFDGLNTGKLRGGNSAIVEVAFFLGTGYMRLGETENCCAKPTAESCILPIEGGGVHTATEGSRQAARYFSEVIERTSRDNYWHLAATWLLNVAHMTLGSYPDSVPEDRRIPAAALTSTLEFPKFRNVARGLGLDTFTLAGGVIVDDFDGDDHLDIVTSNWHSSGQLRFFRNNRDGTFSDRTEASGLDGITGGLNILQADYDNDGDLDFVVLRGAWLFQYGRHPNSLIRNNGDGTFSDVTYDAGLGRVHYPTQCAGWADFDNDGDIDLYIGNESRRSAPAASQLFRNEGDGTFVDVAKDAGVENLGFTKGVTWGDYDDDGLPDLYVSNNGTRNKLYHNEGNGKFVDVASKLGVAEPQASFPTWFWDFDNDGALDLFVSSYDTGIGHIAAHHLKLPRECGQPRLYKGDGRGGFKDVATEANLGYPSQPMGANFGDLDGDGFLDFYLGTGNTHFYSLMPNIMYLNRGGERFVDVTMAGGFGHLQKGHAIAFADLDNDGDQDVFEQMGGAYLGDAFGDALFENPGFDNRWLGVHLVGTQSNRAAIGARIRVEIVEGGKTRSIYRRISSGASFGANPLRQTIGLGKASEIRALEIDWPATGKTQQIQDIPFDRSIRVTEGEDGFNVIDVSTTPFRPR